ncbi:hypothetical protein LUZ60_010841 [Juncus effusus]|nr:hypothetical protein LUZ60_010841 [Juncus effusus]
MAGALNPAPATNSVSSSPSLPDSGTSPDRPLAGADKAGLYDRKLLEELVDELSSVRKMATSPSSSLETKKRKRELEQTVRWLRGVALNPGDPALVVRERERQILSARREMFVKIDDVEDLEELPDFASLRKKKKAWHFSDLRYKNKRRSERISKSFPLSLSSHLSILRKRIGIGRLFQAQIPSHSSPLSLSSYNSDPNLTKYLGTPTWPVNSKTPTKNSKLRKSEKCNCVEPGSVECVRRHVDQARTKLRSELGPAFYSWGFDSMGDYMSNAFLTRQEQLGFEKMESENSKKGFWRRMGEGMEMKRRDLVWYYFNVYLLRRVARMSRNRPGIEIDSCDEDDDVMGDDGEGEDGSSVICRPECVVSSSAAQQRSEKPKRKRC